MPIKLHNLPINNYYIIQIDSMPGSLLTETDHPQSELSTPLQTEITFSFDPMLLLRFIFYIIVILKIFQISFVNRRRRYSLRQRIYRKFTSSYAQLINSFTAHDKLMMKITLNNTQQNVKIEFDPQNRKIRRTEKKVLFQTQNNSYYDPEPSDSTFNSNIHQKQQQQMEQIKTDKVMDVVDRTDKEDLLESNQQTQHLLSNYKMRDQIELPIDQGNTMKTNSINSKQNHILD